jgi:Spx/MgsR family transcriptional regulator
VLSRRRVTFTTRDLIKQPLSPGEIRALAALHPDGVRGLLSTRSPQLKALGLDTKAVGDAELVSLMAREPRLLRRPLVVDGRRLVVGFDREALESLGR